MSERAPVVDGGDLALIALLQAVAVESERFSHRFGELNGLHRTDLNALVTIMEAERSGGPLSPTRLAASIGLSASATTALLDRLAASGHVERVRSSGDRRRVTLVLSERAWKLGRRFFGPLGEAFGRRWTELSEADRQVVARFLSDAVSTMSRVRHGWDD